ncbi:MAG: GNAT family N-acetyltransferase [Methanoregula sp.]
MTWSAGELVPERVNADNFGSFLALLDSLARYENLQGPDNEAKERLKTDALGLDPAFEAYIGRYNDIPVGFVTVVFTYSTFLARPTLYVEDIFVKETYRGRGFGKGLIGFCRTLAQERGCGRMEWRVLTLNQPAIGFYKRCGASRLDWYTYRLTRDQF